MIPVLVAFSSAYVVRFALLPLCGLPLCPEQRRRLGAYVDTQMLLTFPDGGVSVVD